MLTFTPQECLRLLRCGISFDMLASPTVILTSGEVYSHEQISLHLGAKLQATSPISRTLFTVSDLRECSWVTRVQTTLRVYKDEPQPPDRNVSIRAALYMFCAENSGRVPLFPYFNEQGLLDDASLYHPCSKEFALAKEKNHQPVVLVNQLLDLITAKTLAYLKALKERGQLHGWITEPDNSVFFTTGFFDRALYHAMIQDDYKNLSLLLFDLGCDPTMMISPNFKSDPKPLIQFTIEKKSSLLCFLLLVIGKEFRSTLFDGAALRVPIRVAVEFAEQLIRTGNAERYSDVFLKILSHESMTEANKDRLIGLIPGESSDLLAEALSVSYLDVPPAAIRPLFGSR